MKIFTKASSTPKKFNNLLVGEFFSLGWEGVECDGKVRIKLTDETYATFAANGNASAVTHASDLERDDVVIHSLQMVQEPYFVIK